MRDPEDWEGKLGAALRSLAESSRDQTVAPSGAEIRRRAEMRRRRRGFFLPSLLLGCTLAGGTAFGLTAALGNSSPHPSAARPGPTAPQAIVPGHAGPATLAPGPGSGSRKTAPGGSGPSGGTGPSGLPQLVQPLCQLTKTYPYMAYVQGINLGSSGGVLDIIPAVCTRDPQHPGSGKLVPSGTVRQVPLASAVTVLVTSPIGSGVTPSPTGLTQFALGLQQHPDALFGIAFGSGGQVTRISEIYVGGAGGKPGSSVLPSLGSGF